jgi:hypothetical protein
MDTTDTTWADDDGNTWSIRFVEDDDGNLVSVTVTSDTREKLPLTTLTRGIPFGKLLDENRQDRFVHRLKDGEQWKDSTGRTWTAHGTELELWEKPARQKRRTINRDLMEQVAKVYTAARGLRNPTEKVADHFFVSHSTAARWVYQARREPWNTLPPTTKGQST